jgi:hypothetical protein
MQKSMKFVYSVFSLLLSTISFGQVMSQTVRGVIADADSKSPLIGVTVLIPNSSPIKGSVTDVNGQFKIDQVPVGRITLTINYLGYEPMTLPNITVDAGQEVVLDIEMQESTSRLNEVVVYANNKGEALNEMSLVSGRSISVEETKRYAGGFNDPALILSNFAGVTTQGIGSNEVIVRGNSPKYVQWRLEGMEITNPNHFADQNSVGGGISALNNNLLATSDFYTGAFSPEYGDVLAGVYDAKLRKGNNEKFESILGIGILGTDVTVEGPFKKDYRGSFLANYRYSTIGLVNDLGLVDLDGVAPTFQDGAFKIFLPSKKWGDLTLFGLNGYSSIFLEDINPGTMPVPHNDAADASQQVDYKKTSFLLNQGITHTLPLGVSSHLNTTLALSTNGVEEHLFESKIFKIGNTGAQRDSLANRKEIYTSELQKSAYRFSMTYNNKINAKNRIQVGTKLAKVGFAYTQSLMPDSTNQKEILTDFDESINTVRNFISWKYRLNTDLTMVMGVHNMNVRYNHKSTIEPRFAINWNTSDKGTFNAGYGQHSTMESVHNYFAKVSDSNGDISEPNKNLGLLKAHHFVLGYEYRLTKNLRAKLETYYQYLYDLPVENDISSPYATINEGLNFKYVDLVNKGTGENYGVELTIERFFDQNYYFLINTSLYQSKYQAFDGITRNTAYNDNYLINILAGKELSQLGKKDNQTLSLNTKLFFGGGKKYIPLLRDAQGELTVDPNQNQYWDYQKSYNNSLQDIYQFTLSASYKWNKPKSTHELFLNIDNITNRKTHISEFYDNSEPNDIGYVKQFGIFPNLMYRIYL